MNTAKAKSKKKPAKNKKPRAKPEAAGYTINGVVVIPRSPDMRHYLSGKKNARCAA
jgi:hypothetical protein